MKDPTVIASAKVPSELHNTVLHSSVMTLTPCVAIYSCERCIGAGQLQHRHLCEPVQWRQGCAIGHVSHGVGRHPSSSRSHHGCEDLAHAARPARGVLRRARLVLRHLLGDQLPSSKRGRSCPALTACEAS